MYITISDITICLSIDWPSTMDGLTRWSKRLFAAFYTCGILGCVSLVAAITLAVLGRWWPAAGLIALMLLLGAVMSGLEPLMAEVDNRRHEAINAEHADQT
jgi:hypothetical protein